MIIHYLYHILLVRSKPQDSPILKETDLHKAMNAWRQGSRPYLEISQLVTVMELETSSILFQYPFSFTLAMKPQKYKVNFWKGRAFCKWNRLTAEDLASLSLEMSMFRTDTRCKCDWRGFCLARVLWGKTGRKLWSQVTSKVFLNLAVLILSGT